MPNALVVADDLTGAMDTGHGFAARGREVRVALRGFERLDREQGPASSDNADVLAVDTDTRDRDPETAAEAVAAVVMSNPAAVVYKKVDSTLRGNVVPEVDAALEATGADLAVVAPAFPTADRTTIDGCHLVDGTPLSEAGYGVDESNLCAVLDDSRFPVAHVGSDTVDDGEQAVRTALSHMARDSPTLIACDASADSHLAAIATAAESLEAEVLYVGSGGLAKHVPMPGDPVVATATTAAPNERDAAGVLGVVGSVNERTLTQLAAVPDEHVVTLDPAAAVRTPQISGRDAATALRDRLDGAGRAVVTAATNPDDVRQAERAAAEILAESPESSAIEEADDDVNTGARVAFALATAALTTAESRPPAGLVLTGGDTARAVLTELDAWDLALTGDAVADGIPESRILTGPAAGTRVVTKAGGFGDERAILNCLDAVSE